MITPRAYSLIIKHFNDIDKAVVKRTTRKRPWSEIALTSILCDLMDEQTQKDEKLNYILTNLQNDLIQEDGLYGINLKIETIEFPTKYERYISQSDIGIRFVFENKIEPNLSWAKPYFLQAKRLLPNRPYPELYAENARFGSVDKKQQRRIEIINRVMGSNYIKYLMYCPRPEQLNEKIKIKLAYLRNKYLSKNIYDYTKGLNIYNELMTNGDSIKAGLLITNSDNHNLNFGQVHSQLMKSVTPFSWFIAENYLSNEYINGMHPNDKMRANQDKESHRILEIINGVFDGNIDCIENLIERIKSETKDEYPDNFPILPRHSITLKFSIGPTLNSNDQLQKE